MKNTKTIHNFWPNRQSHGNLKDQTVRTPNGGDRHQFIEIMQGVITEFGPLAKPNFNFANYYMLYQQLRDSLELYSAHIEEKGCDKTLIQKFLNLIYDESIVDQIAHTQNISKKAATQIYLKEHPFFSKSHNDLPDLSKFDKLPYFSIIEKAMNEAREIYHSHIVGKNNNSSVVSNDKHEITNESKFGM